MPFPPEDKSFAGLLKDILIRLNLIERRLNKGTAAAGGGGGGGGTGLSPEQVRDIIGTALVAGANVTVTVDDAGDHITIAAPTAGGLDAEAVRDLVGSTLVAGSNVSILVNDALNTITISSTDTTGLDAEAVRDLVGSTLVAGAGITVTVDDTGDTITIAAAAPAAVAGRFRGQWAAGAYLQNDMAIRSGHLVAARVATSADPFSGDAGVIDTFATDPFAGTPRVTAAAGTWSHDAVNLALQTNQASASSGVAFQSNMARAAVGSVDVSVMGVTDPAARQHYGLFMQGVDGNVQSGYRMVHIDTTWPCSRYAAGVETTITTVPIATGPFPIGAAKVLRVEWAWDAPAGLMRVKFFVDGVQVNSFSDPTYNALRPGFFGYQGITRFDNVIAVATTIHADWRRLNTVIDPL